MWLPFLSRRRWEKARVELLELLHGDPATTPEVIETVTNAKLPKRRLFGAGFAGPNMADTVASTGTAPAPGIGGLIVAATIIDPGVYHVRAYLLLSGTAETLAINTALRFNTVQKCRLITLPGPLICVEIERYFCSTIQNLDLTAVAAATAGSVYTGTILATKIG